MKSLRGRFLVGSILWTLGLLLLVHALAIELLHHYPALRMGGGTQRLVYLLVAVAMMAGGAAIVRRGLAVLGGLQARLRGVREGASRRVEGDYPAEVQPLVDDLNRLLHHREQAVERALAAAGDLAHGLKTPLAVLASEVERLRPVEPQAAAGIDEQIERMRRQVDYQLARARASSSGAAPGAYCLVAPAVDGIVRLMGRIHAGGGLEIGTEIDPEHAVRCERQDLDEMLGNLVDNACRWARSRVAIASARAGDTVVITVDDDGRGLAPESRGLVLGRGVRADQSGSGTGLGLAIVRDLAELHGGSIGLEESPWGGLRARLELPPS